MRGNSMCNNNVNGMEKILMLTKRLANGFVLFLTEKSLQRRWTKSMKILKRPSGGVLAGKRDTTSSLKKFIGENASADVSPAQACSASKGFPKL
ncbi:hypothetical protein QE152_g1323 [Popillia japonica]|uniref:Uncharacterized protein n=1 Tax=Popillia japonica TaxID=7064 RepID=A0AAW1N2X9_POPJA